MNYGDFLVRLTATHLRDHELEVTKLYILHITYGLVLQVLQIVKRSGACDLGACYHRSTAFGQRWISCDLLEDITLLFLTCIYN